MPRRCSAMRQSDPLRGALNHRVACAPRLRAGVLFTAPGGTGAKAAHAAYCHSDHLKVEAGRARRSPAARPGRLRCSEVARRAHRISRGGRARRLASTTRRPAALRPRKDAPPVPSRMDCRALTDPRVFRGRTKPEDHATAAEDSVQSKPCSVVSRPYREMSDVEGSSV